MQMIIAPIKVTLRFSFDERLHFLVMQAESGAK
jgi:hypothetical protein